MTNLEQNKNEENYVFPENVSYIEPNIRKAKFVVTENRMYTLEFDQNIQMEELKMMIEKAAHLRKNSYGLSYVNYK